MSCFCLSLLKVTLSEKFTCNSSSLSRYIREKSDRLKWRLRISSKTQISHFREKQFTNAHPSLGIRIFLFSCLTLFQKTEPWPHWQYMFPSLFAGVTFLKNFKPRIPKLPFLAKISLILVKNSSFPSLFAVFASVNNQNREYRNRE